MQGRTRLLLRQKVEERCQLSRATLYRMMCQAADVTPLHSFRTLLEDLVRVARNVCRAEGQKGKQQSEFELDTQLSAEQARALELLNQIRS